MHQESHTNGINTPHSADTLKNLSPSESEMILQISRLYTALEYIANNEAGKLANSGKANIKRAQGELQKLRLKMLDYFKEKQSL